MNKDGYHHQRAKSRRHATQTARWFVKGLLAWALIILAGMAGEAKADDEARIWSVKEGRMLSFDQLIDEVRLADLVFIGEEHSNKDHHEVQLAVIQGLWEIGADVAVGLEMFKTLSQSSLDAWVAGQIGIDKFRGVFSENWRMDWSLYQDIFVYARDRSIPLVALNLDRSITRRVAVAGFQSLTEEERAGLPNVECLIDPDYEKYLRQAFDAHPHNGMEFKYFCEAQILWDAFMAVNLSAFLDSRPGSLVVVLAGGGHAWKFGIPYQVKKLRQGELRVILPERADRLDRSNARMDETDYLWLAEKRSRALFDREEAGP